MASAKLLRFTDSSIVIAGQQIPIGAWSVTLSNQGSMATARAETSLILLDNSGVDVISLSQTTEGAEFDIYAGYDGNSALLFSGVLDECEGDEADDKFEICGRDHAASLADGMQTVAGLNYRNQSVAQIVTQIANKFGFTPQVTDPGIMAGPLMGGENSFNPRPQTFWSLLQKLASDVGYEVYITPDKSLYFGPEQDQGSVNMSWMASPGSEAENPLIKFTWKYNPRNNSNITVKVISQDVNSMQRVVGTATANKQSVGGGKKKKKHHGSDLVTQRPVHNYGKGGSGAFGAAKSTYFVYANGLTADQAQAKAEAMAKDLAKRQIIICGELEGLPTLKVHSHVQLSGTRFDGLDFNVAEVTHSFSMGEGFMTSFRALALVDE